MKNEIKYIMYCRKSTEGEDRQVHSIQDQKKVLRELGERRNANIVKVFGEEKSAKKPGRLLFAEMVQMIKTGKADGIICWKLNRLARNPIDGGEIQWLLQEGIIREIMTPEKGYLPGDNAVVMAVELGIANQYSRDLSIDVRRGLTEKAKRGIFPVAEKPGYAFQRISQETEKVLVPDEQRFSLLQKAMKQIASGQDDPARVFEKLNDEWAYRTAKRRRLGGKPMARSMFYRILSDSFYYGEFEYPKGSGQVFKGIHQPMITENEYDRIQIVLGRKGRPRPSKHKLPYTGIMKCGECKCSVTATVQWQVICSQCKFKFSSRNTTVCPKCATDTSQMTNPTVLHYVRYHCTKKRERCAQGSIEVKELERQVDKFLAEIPVSKRFQEWAIKCLNEENEKEAQGQRSQLKSVQEAYNDCVKRLQNLLALKISPQNSNGSLLSDEDYGQQKQRLEKEKRSWEEKLSGVGADISNWIKTVETGFEFSRNAAYWLQHGTLDDKRAIFRALGLNLVLNDQTVRIDGPSLFLLMKEARQKEPSISERLEPVYMGARSQENANLEKIWDASPILSGE